MRKITLVTSCSSSSSRRPSLAWTASVDTDTVTDTTLHTSALGSVHNNMSKSKSKSKRGKPPRPDQHISSNWKKLMPSVQSNGTKKVPAPGSRGARKLAAAAEYKKRKLEAAAAPARSAAESPAGLGLTPQRMAAPVALPPLDPVRAAESELTKWLALDCEMVGVGPRGSKSALAQVAIVNDRELPVYVCYVKPAEFVTDYRTRFSGVRPFHMKHALPFHQVQKEVRRFPPPCTALHGPARPARLLSRRLSP